MIHLEREHLRLIVEAGYVYLGMQRFSEAQQVFEGLCSLAPESDVPVIALGNALFCQGELKEAIAAYQRALALDPQSLFAKAYLGEALFFSHQRDEALTLLREVDAADEGAAGDFARALLKGITEGAIVPPKELPRQRKSHALKKVH